ncbi:FtsX-like permease family protein [Microbacterium terricola]|uniref:ABC3 transporter permease C-terminal domain-containing protein n=1 Tax=Microbacterium terricola TaxID=344163 RepID=A0ABM8DWH4_9MICO|nr:FtsX-like permease family protein [Microbacterium terricola]UYK39315.1 hypothetical protein OAU46_11475 [Microbacterium terricola]BDV29962.1 hypothetical protein Microterr_06220 [Microbacterium terricola]
MTRLLRRQLRPHLAALVLLAVTAGVLTAGLTTLPRVLTRVADERFAAVFAQESIANVTISGEPAEAADPATVIGTLKSVLEPYPRLVDAPLADAMGEADWQLVLEPWSIGVATAPGDAVRFALGISPTLAAHADVVAGAAPAPWKGDGPLEVAVSQAVADRLRLGVGDRLESDAAPLVVSGIIAPRADASASPGDADRFAPPAEEPLAAGGAKITARAWIDEGGAGALGASLARARLTASYPIHGAGLSPDDIPALTDALRAASSARLLLRNAAPLNVTSRLAVALDALDAADAALSAAAVLIASAPLGGLAATVLLAAQAFAARRRSARRLLSARGAGVSRLARDGAVETAIAVVPAVVLGAASAVLVVPGELGPMTALPAIAVAIAACVVAAVLAARAAATASVHPALRLIGELVVLSAAVVAGILLLRRGLALTDAGVDPLLAVAPLLAALAVSVLLVRALPWVLRAIERALSRGRGAVSLVAVARVARSATLGVAATLAIVIAVSATTLSATLSATLDGAATAAARQSVGGDLRLSSDSALPSVDGVARVGGVAAAVEVRRLEEAVIAEEGRERAALVLVADAERWNRTRPDLDLPAASDGALAAVLSDELTLADHGALTLDGAPLERAATARTAELPTDGASWVLLDAAAVAGEHDTAAEWMLVRTEPGASTATVAARLHEAFGAELDIADAETTRAELTAQPAFAALRGILQLCAVASLVMALLAVLLAVLGAAAERARTLGALRMLGMPAGRAAVVVLWETLPGAISATAAGAGLGIVLAALLVAAADLGATVGGVALALDPPIAAIALGGVVFVLVIAGAGTALAAWTVRVPPRGAVRMGA